MLDSQTINDTVDEFRRFSQDVFPISAITGNGIKPLLERLYQIVTDTRGKNTQSDKNTMEYSPWLP
jgi:predicted GTPase